MNTSERGVVAVSKNVEAAVGQWRILLGDVRQQLAQLEAGSVQTCITSPPYWGLRDYGYVAQIGLEVTPEAYTASLVQVFAEVWRVLRHNGCVWLNLGDSYANTGNPGQDFSASKVGYGGKGRGHLGGQPMKQMPPSLKSKDLIGIPWRVAFALQADGWYLRSDIIWSKPNPMPESVTDRPTKAHEYIFLLSKAPRYYYDAEAIAEAATCDRLRGPAVHPCKDTNGNSGLARRDSEGQRNRRSVWTVATQSFAGAHFATFPEDLITPCVLAGSRVGDTVLDPFCGSGTTGVVALNHQRNFIGIELNPTYVELARQRIGNVSPLFAREMLPDPPQVEESCACQDPVNIRNGLKCLKHMEGT